MCGIAAILGYRTDGAADERALIALRDAQSHRGPDDADHWLSADRRVALGHRRLSIVDLSERGRQPMATPDGRYRIVYNGEIYNFPELRAELERGGAVFESTSDTEVILHGYRAWGISLLDRLRGMFAFALHDAERRETLLARDPLGIKPLYYADDGARLWVASEVQALRAVVDAGDVDPEGLAAYLLWGSIAAPRTLYQRVRSLPAGAWLRVRDGGLEGPSRYFRLEDAFGGAQPMTEDEAEHALREALFASARCHLLADVPVGAFLSGGVDSSALVGLLSELHNAPIRTVTLSFDVPEYDEGELAEQAAKLYGSDHRDIRLRIEEVRQQIPEAIGSLDQPSCDGVNTYFVSQAAVQAGLKVAVSGVGGDEVFGGYASFTRCPRIRSVHDRLAALPLAARWLPGVARAMAAWPQRSHGTKLALALAHGGDDAGAYYTERALFSPAQVRALLAPGLADAVDAVDPVAELRRELAVEQLPVDERVSAFELARYMRNQLLRDTDAVSMRHSLEVRTPLVDRTLLEAVAKVPAALRRSGPAKRWLRQAPRPPVPEALWNRRKQGFTLPFDHWLRTGGLAIELPEHPWLRPDAVEQVADEFRRGRIHVSRLWTLLVLRHFLP